jgi:hypothetical protein
VPQSGYDVYLRHSGVTNRGVAITPETGTLPEVVSVFIDGFGGGAAALRIEAGAAHLRAYAINPGGLGVGSVVQVGGVVGAQQLNVGMWNAAAGSRGSYSLAGGRLEVDTFTLLANSGAIASMGQTGGMLHADTGSVQGEGATYDLAAGELVVADLGVSGGAVFTQTGGSVSMERFGNADGEYRWLGGDLTIRQGWRLAGKMTFPNAPVTVNLNGMVEFEAPVLTNAGNVSLRVGAESVVNRASDFDPAKVFGSYENAGVDHIVGTVLTIPSGRKVRSVGAFYDPVTVYGSIGQPADDSVENYLEGVLTLHPGGSVDVLDVRAFGVTSTIYGGTLKTGRLVAMGTGNELVISGPPPERRAGRILQEGGAVAAALLQVGFSGEAEYILSGGELVTETAEIGPWSTFHSLDGVSPSGVFRQTGGTHRAGVLRMGAGGIPEGTYVLSGGALLVGVIEVGGHSPLWPYVRGERSGVGHFRFENAEANLAVTSAVVIGERGEFTATPGAVLQLRGASLSVLGTDSQKVSGFDVLRVVFEGPEASSGPGEWVESRLEVAGEDWGPSVAGFVENFVIDTLQVGGAGAAWVRLVDEVDNQLGSAVGDVLYVRHLILNEGSVLDLGGRKLYVLDFENAGGTVETNEGALTVVPEPGVLGVGVLALLAGRRAQRTRRRGMPH